MTTSERKSLSKAYLVRRPEMGTPYPENNEKANLTMAFLRRNLKTCPEHCKKAAYISLVRPILDYSLIVWDPYYTYIQDIAKIEQIQKQAARFITRNYMYHSREKRHHDKYVKGSWT